MNKFIGRQLVSTQDLGHHQAMIQECEHVQKIKKKLLSRRSPPFTLIIYVKYIEVKPITTRPKDIIKYKNYFVFKNCFFKKNSTFKKFHEVEGCVIICQLWYSLKTTLRIKVLVCCMLQALLFNK